MSNKGGTFERDVCKYLSIWLKGKEKPYQYWRMPGSGALCTISEDNKNLSGDIRALTEDASFLTREFSIECKTGYPSTTFWQHYRDIKTFHIRSFWQQCVGDAKKSGKSPMLIYRKKGKKPIVGLDVNKAQVSYSLNALNSMIIVFKKEYDLPWLQTFDMEEFFSTMSPGEMKKFCGVYDNGVQRVS